MIEYEIIKALDCCYSEFGNMCSICPLFDPDNDFCEDELHRSIFYLINRQKAEIEDLKERLEIANGHGKMMRRDVPIMLKEAKSEAIKEFAEQLKKRFYLLNGRCVVDVPQINNLVKIMAEE